MAPEILARVIDRNSFGGALNRGHIIRTGHPLDAVALSFDGGAIYSQTIRRCCGDTVPPGVEWIDDNGATL